MADQKIGTITHYYDKIGVAVIKLTKGDLKVGDTVKLVKKDGQDYVEDVKSMQIEHADIDIAKSGDEFGLKVGAPIKENSDVVKVK